MNSTRDTPEVGVSTSSSSLAPLDYEADIETEIEPFMQRWKSLLREDSSPFHAMSWIRAWYNTLGKTQGRRPLLLGVRRRDTGADVMLLPLTYRCRGGVSIVEYVDGGVVDYVSPLLASDWAGGSYADAGIYTSNASSLWQSVCQALRGYDVLRINKMLSQPLNEVMHSQNPLTLALHLQECELFGNQFHVPGDWDSWRHTLDKRVRKEFERSWRVFTRSEHARFERVTDPIDAFAILDQLEKQQALRMNQMGYNYVLDQPAYRGFYRQTLANGLADGSAILTALRDGEHVVAAQFGVASKHRYIALRLSTGGDEWKQCSPGRLMCERTARHMYEQGLRWFDFGIGDYFHKETFLVNHIPLHDVCVPLSWRGQPFAWAWRLRRALKRQKSLVTFWHHLKTISKSIRLT